jgi:hypothetical protein
MSFKPTVPQESRLTPLWQAEDEVSNSGRRYEAWICRCQCGNNHRVRLHRLQRGTTKSCGCLRRELGNAQIDVARAARSKQAAERRLANAQ